MTLGFYSLSHQKSKSDPTGALVVDQVKLSEPLAVVWSCRIPLQRILQRCRFLFFSRYCTPLITHIPRQGLISILSGGCLQWMKTFSAYLQGHQSFFIFSVQTCSSVRSNTSCSLENYFWINTGPGQLQWLTVLKSSSALCLKTSVYVDVSSLLMCGCHLV